jgi:hypothetical protein
MLSCPHTLYMTHLAPILGPVFEHLQYRLDKTWLPIISSAVTPDLCKPLYNADCVNAAALASRGGDDWFVSYYSRTGLFVGDVDVVTGEAAVEKSRVELSRTFSDMLQTALALKGDWALVLANFAKDEQSNRRNDGSKLSQGPRTRIQVEGFVNADGTPKTENQAEIDARKLQRISAMCHFLFLGHEQIAGSITLLVIQCLAYPDAYTCRRISRICHRILETVAWYPRYTELLGNRMFLAAIKNIVTEPKWMVGIEWDMINVVRDIYIRLVLGQVVQPGGQGVALQQAFAGDNPNHYEQAKTADQPLQGGGILVIPSNIPRQVLASLPGVDTAMINQLDADLKRKKSAKDQKDGIRDLLRIASEQIKQADDAAAASFPNGLGGSSSTLGGALERAVEEESLLRNHHRKAEIEDLPEKLVTHSMMVKKHQKNQNQDQEQQSSIKALGLAAFQL